MSVVLSVTSADGPIRTCRDRLPGIAVPGLIAVIVSVATFMEVLDVNHRECRAAPHRRQPRRQPRREHLDRHQLPVSNAIVLPVSGWLPT